MNGYCQKTSHVLLVEDDPDHADLVTLSLMESQPKAKVVHHVSDGDAALDYLLRRGDFVNPDQSPRPHLILLDLRLPKVDGLAMLKAIRQRLSSWSWLVPRALAHRPHTVTSAQIS